MLPQGMQGCCKTQGFRTTNVRACTHVFCPKMPQDCHAISVQRPCGYLRMLRTIPHPMKFAWPHLRQTCNSESTSGDSPARERKTIVGASYGCLTFSENLLEVCNFVCDLPHHATARPNHRTIDVKQAVSHQSNDSRTPVYDDILLGY